MMVAMEAAMAGALIVAVLLTQNGHDVIDGQLCGVALDCP